MAAQEQIKIVEGNDSKKFTKEVNELLMDGWRLHGDVTIQSHSNRELKQSYDSRDPDYHTTVIRTYFAQALITVLTGP